METQEVGWQWDEADMGGCITTHQGCFVFAVDVDKGSAEIRRIAPSGNSTLLWSVPAATAKSAALALKGSILFVALYSRSATGCRILALETDSCQKLWETSLKGIGSIGHSKYSNQIQIRLMNEWLVIFGREESGRYIEILDLIDGRLVSSRKV
jgi:hypothetical protein